MVKISSGPGFLLVHTMGVKAALPPSPPTNTPIYTNKQATALAQRSFSCHPCCTSCSVIHGAVSAMSAGERAQLLLTLAEISRGLAGLNSMARHCRSVSKLLLASVSSARCSQSQHRSVCSGYPAGQ